MLNGLKQHDLDEESTTGSSTIFTMGFTGADFNFSLTANSSDSGQGEHHLSETFEDGALDYSTEQHIRSGSGSSSSSFSFAFDLGDNNWYTYTGSTSESTSQTSSTEVLKER